MFVNTIVYECSCIVHLNMDLDVEVFRKPMKLFRYVVLILTNLPFFWGKISVGVRIVSFSV